MLDSYLMALVSKHILHSSSFVNVGSADVPFEITREEGSDLVLVIAKHEEFASISWGEFLPLDSDPEFKHYFAQRVCERLSMLSLLSQHPRAQNVIEVVSEFHLFPNEIKMHKGEECMTFDSPFGYQVIRFYPNTNLMRVFVTWGHFRFKRDFRLTPITDSKEIINAIEGAMQQLGIER